MKSIEKYYDVTEADVPRTFVKYFIEKIKCNPTNAIDLGCGAGNDTVYLIKNGWNVLAIDRENVESRITKRLTTNELQHFKFEQQSFEKIKLKKSKLIVANYSLSFCNKERFEDLWNEIKMNLEKDGYFVGNFFGVNDTWNKTRPQMTFFSKNQVCELFKNFDILNFKEVEVDKRTGLGELKHWHIFHVIAENYENGIKVFVNWNSYSYHIYFWNKFLC